MLVHRMVIPSIKFASTHLYTWVEKGTVRVKCLAQEHNTMSLPGLEPGLLDPETSALTMRPPCLHNFGVYWYLNSKPLVLIVQKPLSCWFDFRLKLLLLKSFLCTFLFYDLFKRHILVRVGIILLVLFPQVADRARLGISFNPRADLGVFKGFS